MQPLSCRDRLEQALARIADPNGEGARACLSVYADAARAAADAADARAAHGVSHGPLDGAIVSIKDLFDVAGEPTRAGSKILAEEAAPAEVDAVVVRRLRAAGAVIVAKTNMTEFAYSAIGANPHFGTPGNPRDRARVPGGSSAGAAVAAADGLCEIAIGSDTGGSVRIPAALCGIVGFKPSRQRIPTEGAFPLELHARLDRAARRAASPIAPRPTRSWPARILRRSSRCRSPACVSRLAEGLPLEGLDDTVAAAFAAALDALDGAGVRITRDKLSLFDDMAEVNAKGGIVPPEACAIHRDRLKRRAADVDPNVRVRIERGCAVPAADYIETVRARAAAACGRWIGALPAPMRWSCRPRRSSRPRIAEVADPKVFAARNFMLLRNTAIGNFFDLCAISLPLPAALPVGLMLLARNGQDRMLLRIAAAVEKLFG